MSSIRAARTVALMAHHGQRDKSGAPSVEHPARVAAAVEKAGGLAQAVQVAYLHDVIEDSEFTLDDLRAFRFAEQVVEAVDAITHRPHEAREAYYIRVRANPLALLVKEHDINDNTDPARLALLSPAIRDRLVAKYDKARRCLGLVA